MMKKRILISQICCIFLLCTIITSCYIHTRVAVINRKNIVESKTFVIESPAKAHLTDGSLIIFANGLEIRDNILKGKGFRYDLARQNYYRFSEITMDSVACLKCYEKELQLLPSVMCNPVFEFISIFESLEYLSFRRTVEPD